MSRFITLPLILVVGLLMAACGHTGSQVSAGSTRYTLAVLPWQVVQAWNSGGNTFETTMSGFQSVLEQAAFTPVFSYYDLPQSTAIIRGQHGIERLWSGRGALDDPDHNVAFELGRQLGVDAVMTYAISELQNQDYLYVYLYDIASHLVHQAQTNTGNFTREGSRAVINITRRAFAKFIRTRAQTAKSAQ